MGTGIITYVTEMDSGFVERWCGSQGVCSPKSYTVLYIVR